MHYVSVGRRFLAILIDTIIVGTVTAPLGSAHTVNGTWTYQVVGFPALLSFAIWIGYFTVMEATLAATVGKFALGIRVRKADGTDLDWGSSLLRNVLRIVDGFPYFIPYLVGAICVWSSPTRQRVGDRVGSTIVVTKARAPVGPSSTAGAPAPLAAPPPVPPPPPPPPPQS